MLTREQIYTMLLLRKRQNTPFSPMDIPLIQKISAYGQGPDSAITKALHYVAYAQREDKAAFLSLLDANPRLLLEACDVKTPGGDEVKRVTPYEFLLGAGDYELAEKVEAYFAKIKDGAQERRRQYERYRPHIEGLLNQKPYDLSFLIDLIRKASPEEITSLLNKDKTVSSELGEALIQFRKDWAPRILLKPSMHYNYASLKHAFELLSHECSNLYKARENNSDKTTLIWRQLIGFEMRRLPGIDRSIIGTGLLGLMMDVRPIHKGLSIFPVTDSDVLNDGLGWDYAIDIMTGWILGGEAPSYTAPLHTVQLGEDAIEKLMFNKKSKLVDLQKSN